MLARTLLALLITLVLEVPAVALFYPQERARMALACAGATTFTNVVMNTVLLRMATSYASYLLVGEIAAVLLEAAVYAVVSKRREVGRALLASAVANSLSFGAGLIFMR